MTYIGPQTAAERRRIEIEQAIARTGLISGAMAETGCTYNEARAVWTEMLGEAPRVLRWPQKVSLTASLSATRNDTEFEANIVRHPAGHGNVGRKPDPREHGTQRGYEQHRRNCEPYCDDCRAAHAAYERIRRAQHLLREEGVV